MNISHKKNIYECATKCWLMCWRNTDLDSFKMISAGKEFKEID